MMNLLWDNIFKKEEKAQKISNILSQNKLFSNLTRRELRIVEDLVHERHYRTGETIFKQGEIGIGMYLLAKGAVEISVFEHDHLDPSNENFRPVLVTKLKKGDFFGELSLVEDNGKRTAQAVCIEDCILIGFFRPDLNVLLQSYPAIGAKVALNLAETLGRRLKSTTEKISQLRNDMRNLSELQKSNEASNPANQT